jgi:hypothetical protein
VNNRLLFAVEAIGLAFGPCCSWRGRLDPERQYDRTDYRIRENLVEAIQTKSQMAKDRRLPEFFRDIYRRDADTLHSAYI